VNALRWAWLFWVVAGLTIEGLAIYEAEGNTLSETVWLLTKHYPLVAFLAGLLMGHFFWQRVGNGNGNGKH
jgi:hypothetical protein